MRRLFGVLAVAVCAITLSSSVSASGNGALVGHWRFNGDLEDSSGRGNDGTFVGGSASYAPSPFGKALNLAAGQYVSVPDSPSLNVSDVTIAAWVKTSGILTEKMVISRFNASLQGFYLEIYQGRVTFAINGNTYHTGNTTLPENTWVNVAASYDGATMKVYLNGVLDGSWPSSSGIGPLSEPLYIGGYTYSPGAYPFSGQIDEVRIWKQALTAEQLLEKQPFGLDEKKWKLTPIQGLTGGGYAVLDNDEECTGSNLDVTVVLKNATPNFPFAVYLENYGQPIGVIGSLTTSAEGNGRFHARVNLIPGFYNLGVDVATIAGSDQYLTANVYGGAMFTTIFPVHAGCECHEGREDREHREHREGRYDHDRWDGHDGDDFR